MEEFEPSNYDQKCSPLKLDECIKFFLKKAGGGEKMNWKNEIVCALFQYGVCGKLPQVISKNHNRNQKFWRDPNYK